MPHCSSSTTLIKVLYERGKYNPFQIEALNYSYLIIPQTMHSSVIGFCIVQSLSLAQFLVDLFIISLSFAFLSHIACIIPFFSLSLRNVVMQTWISFLYTGLVRTTPDHSRPRRKPNWGLRTVLCDYRHLINVCFFFYQHLSFTN